MRMLALRMARAQTSFSLLTNLAKESVAKFGHLKAERRIAIDHRRCVHGILVIRNLVGHMGPSVFALRPAAEGPPDERAQAPSTYHPDTNVGCEMKIARIKVFQLRWNSKALSAAGIALAAHSLRTALAMTEHRQAGYRLSRSHGHHWDIG
jgi:hypothetical protein